MPRKGGKQNFIVNSFTLSKEHVELSKIVGVNMYELIDQYLQNLEIDLKLKPNSLIVYYIEDRKSYYEYWYTEDANKKHVEKFEESIFSFNNHINPILN